MMPTPNPMTTMINTKITREFTKKPSESAPRIEMMNPSSNTFFAPILSAIDPPMSEAITEEIANGVAKSPELPFSNRLFHDRLLLFQSSNQKKDENGDRDVNQEDPLPFEHLEDQATNRRTCNGSNPKRYTDQT